MSDDDPVLRTRARVGKWAETGQRVGYACFAVAVVAFFFGFAAGFPTWTVTVSVAALAIGSVVLAPAIVAGYGVKAAAREDRERGRGT